MKIVFYYDIVCPYAYLASQQIDAVARRIGAELEWTPILLGGVFRSIGAPDTPAQPEAKASLAKLDMARWASLLAVPFTLPASHPQRTLDAMRLCHTVEGAARTQLTQALYRAYFVDGSDITAPATLAAACAAAGLPTSLVEQRGAADIKDKLRAATDQAVADGVFGVPAFVLVRDDGTRTLFWGQDRLPLLRRAAGDPTPPFELGQGGASGETVTFHYDFSSPYAYLAATQVERIVGAHGAQVRWRPMLLGALFRAIGSPMVPLETFPAAKRRYYERDMQDWAELWGVPIRWPSRFPMRTLLPLRLALACPEAKVAELSRRIFAAYWVDDRDIADPAVLTQLCAEVGVDPALVAKADSDAALKQALIDSTAEAQQAGVCGAPSFVTRGQLLWGQDRLPMLSRLLGGWEPPVPR